MTAARQVVAALALFAAALLQSGCGDASEQDMLKAARASAEGNDLSSASVQLKALLQKYPDSGESRRLLGETLLKLGDPSGAAVELEKARVLKQPDAVVLPALAEAWLRSGQAKKVLEQLGPLALPDVKASAQLKIMVASAWVELGSLERADAKLTEALGEDPSNLLGLLLKAKLQAAARSFDGALELLDKILAQDPKRAEALLFKGQVQLHGKGDSPAALATFRQLLAHDPRYLPAHAAVMKEHLRLQDAQAFKAQLKQLKAVHPDHPETRFYEVYQLLLDGELKPAREGAQKLLQRQPENALVLQLSGAVEMQTGSLQTAASHFIKALQLAPNLYGARKMLAEAYLRAGQPLKAMSSLQPLLAVERPNPAVLGVAAEAFLQLGELDKAEKLYTEAAKAAPDDVRTRTSLLLTQIAAGKVDRGDAALDALASRDSGTHADLALISGRMARKELDNAAQAITRLQAKLPGKPLPWHLQGQLQLLREDRAAARQGFEKALSLDPAYVPALTALASLDIVENRPAESVKRLESILATDPSHAGVLLALADANRRAGAKPEVVSELYTRAVKLNPTDAAARQALVDHLLGRRHFKAALQAAQEAVSALPDNPQVVDALGRAQMMAGDLQQAINTFGKLAIAQPTSAGVQLRLAEAHLADKNTRMAAQSFRKALDLSPKLLPAQQGLVRVALQDKKPDAALAVARKVQAERPDEAVGFVMEADIQIGQRNFAGSASALQTALARSKSTELAKRLHSAYAVANKPAEADQFAAKWERDNPADMDFVAHLGAMALDRKDFSLAEAKFRKVLEVKPSDPFALNNVAWLMVQQKKPGALPFALRANEVLPEMGWIMDTLAAAYLMEGQVQQAIDWQLKAVKKSPETASYRLGLAQIYIAAGRKADAKAELEKLLASGERFAGREAAAALLKGL